MGSDQLTTSPSAVAALIAAVAALALAAGWWVAVSPVPASVFFIELPLFGTLGFFYAMRGLRDEARRSARTIFVLALFVRLAALAVVHALADPNQIAPDQVQYDLNSAALAEHWRTGEPLPPANAAVVMVFYHRMCAALYLVLGRTPLGPKVLNAVVGALSAAVLYRLSRRFMEERTARTTGLLAALFPSLVLWSVLQIRDALVVFAVVASFDAFYSLRERRTPASLIELAVVLALAMLLRPYIANMLAAVVVMGWFAGSARKPSVRRLATNILVLTLVVIWLRESGHIQPLVEAASLEKLQQTREGLAVGAAAFAEEADVSTLGGALAHLPVGVAYFLLGPFPWTVETGRQLLAMPETYLWYALLPLVVVGMWRVWRTEGVSLLPVIAFMGAVTLTYSLVEGNLGTAYRHRAQVMILFLVFAGVGLEYVLERRRAPAAEDRWAPFQTDVDAKPG